MLYSIGQNHEGQLITAVLAEKGTHYTCPSCEGGLVLKKGKVKRPHFAHKALHPNCTPEGALHYGFKSLLHRRIQNHLDACQPLEMEWNCSCGEVHAGNLLKKASSVRLEADLGVCRPDLALFDDSGRCIAVIEVVVTHYPEESAIDYYRSENIVLIGYVLESDEELSRVALPILKPDSVGFCRNPKCKECGHPMRKEVLKVVETPCRRCSRQMKVAVKGSSFFDNDFTATEIKIASAHGVCMRSQFNKTQGRRYIANTCRACGTWIGEWYLRDCWELPGIEVITGYRCNNSGIGCPY